tara:strand:- start:36 stop:557 length:522 start_codon:yes stop_codon:yes gene_type:complete
MKILIVIIILSIIISLYQTNKVRSDSIYEKKGNKFRNNFIIVTIIVMIFVFIYIKTIWVQMLDVGPEDGDVDYTNKVIWINMRKIDVTNNRHKKWSNNMLINNAPNKLGSYIDMSPKNMTRGKLLEHIEKFNIMFKHPLKYMYFRKKPSNQIVKFLKEKQITIVRKTFRRTIK